MKRHKPPAWLTCWQAVRVAAMGTSPDQRGALVRAVLAIVTGEHEPDCPAESALVAKWQRCRDRKGHTWRAARAAGELCALHLAVLDRAHRHLQSLTPAAALATVKRAELAIPADPFDAF